VSLSDVCAEKKRCERPKSNRLFKEGVRVADMYGYIRISWFGCIYVCLNMDQERRKDLINFYPKFKTILPIYLFSVSLFIATTLNKWFI
jgi:hypothetical protein